MIASVKRFSRDRGIFAASMSATDVKKLTAPQSISHQWYGIRKRRAYLGIPGNLANGILVPDRRLMNQQRPQGKQDQLSQYFANDGQIRPLSLSLHSQMDLRAGFIIVFPWGQGSQGRQGPNPLRPWNGHQQHQTMPTQTPGFHHVSAARSYWVTIDAPGFDFGAPTTLDAH